MFKEIKAHSWRAILYRLGSDVIATAVSTIVVWHFIPQHVVSSNYL